METARRVEGTVKCVEVAGVEGVVGVGFGSRGGLVLDWMK